MSFQEYLGELTELSLLLAAFLVALTLGGIIEEAWRTRWWTRRDKWED
jgi:hypothetical protein